MIKSLNKDDITSIPFVVSKRWRATSKSNPNFLMGNADFDYYYSTLSFVSESASSSFVSESADSIGFITEADITGVASFETKPLALEFIDYGDGWQFGCTSSLISEPSYSVIIENTSSGEITVEVEGSTDYWLLESYTDLSSSKPPYNGPAYRFNLSMDVPFTNSICNLCLEQSEDNFLTIEDGVKIEQFVKFNPNIEQQNLNDTYKRIIYDQINNLFYNDSKDPTKLLGLENLDTFLDGKSRVIYDRIKVVTIPQAYFGDKIMENSVEIIEDSSDQTYTVVDDGEGNLYVKENVFGVIVSDQNKDINYFNSCSYVNFDRKNFYINGGSTSEINWQYYKNNIIFMNRDVADSFYVRGYDSNDVINPVSTDSYTMYVGDGSGNIHNNIPHERLLGNFKKIECGENFVAILKTNGNLVVWGTGSVTSSIPSFDSIIDDVSAGSHHIIAMDNNGKIYVWGDSSYTGSIPTSVSNNYSYIKAGPSGSVAIHKNGSIYGFGHSSANSFFTSIPQKSNVKKITIGKLHGMILDNEGNLYSWGNDSTYSQSKIPNSHDTNVLDVDCGDDHTIIVKNNGECVSWGKNDFSQSFIPFGQNINSEWSPVIPSNSVATKGMNNVFSVIAKANRSLTFIKRYTDTTLLDSQFGKSPRFAFSWGEDPFVTKYMFYNIGLGRKFTILDPNVKYQKNVYYNDYTSNRLLKGTTRINNTLEFDINLNTTKQYNLTDYKVKIPKSNDPHGTPMFSGLEVLSQKYNNKEIYSYIASGATNEISMGVGKKEFYLDTGSFNLADEHYGGYINTTTYITKLTSNISMGQTGSRDYGITMTGRFVSYDKYQKKLTIYVDSSTDNQTHNNWAIDFERIIVPEIIDELDLSNSNFEKFYLSGSGYVTSSNINSIIKDEQFVHHYVENNPNYNYYS